MNSLILFNSLLLIYRTRSIIKKQIEVFQLICKPFKILFPMINKRNFFRSAGNW